MVSSLLVEISVAEENYVLVQRAQRLTDKQHCAALLCTLASNKTEQKVKVGPEVKDAKVHFGDLRRPSQTWGDCVAVYSLPALGSTIRMQVGTLSRGGAWGNVPLPPPTPLVQRK